MNERIQLILDRAEGPTILDLGAVQHDATKANSDNWLHDHLREEFHEVIGVDILAEEVEALNEQGYDMKCADVEQMDFPIKADTIVAGELIEHLSNPGLMLDRVHEHLHDDGKLIISTPNPWAWIFLKRLTFGYMEINSEHTAWFGPTVMRQLLERHAFELVRTDVATRNRTGIMRWLQKLQWRPLNGTTWVFTAVKA